MKKIGISCGKIVQRYGIDRALEICKASGFDAVDFSLEAYKLSDKIYGGSLDAFESHFNAIKEKADSLELEISQTHGRCKTYAPDDDAGNRDADILNAMDIRATSLLSAPSCVIHFINNSRWGKQPAEFMHSKNAEVYDKIIPYAEKFGVNIAMETFGAARVSGARIRDFFADPTEFKRQFERLNTRNKTVCVDTGHIHEAESFWVPPPEEMIKILGSDISILHLHDNSGHWDDHLLPGMGNINWRAVFDALDSVGYSGVYNFELGLGFAGKMLEEYLGFAGKYLRAFVDNHGSFK